MKAIKVFLVLFIFIEVSFFAYQAACKEKEKKEEEGDGQQCHVVKKEDNFRKLSAEYGVTAKEIIAANTPDKFGYTCVSPDEEHTTRKGKIIVRCRRVYYWLRSGKTIIIPYSAKKLAKEKSELIKENEALKKEQATLKEENRILLSRLLDEKDKNEALGKGQKQETKPGKINLAGSRAFESNAIRLLVGILVVCIATLLISTFRKGRVRVDQNVSVGKAREDLIKDRQKFGEEQKAVEKDLAARRKELDEREKAVQTEGAHQSAEFEADLKEQQAVLDARAGIIKKKEDKLEERETTVKTREESIEAEQKRLANRLDEIGKLGQEAVEREERVKEREGEITKHEKKITQIYQKLSQREKAVEERERAAAAKAKALEQIQGLDEDNSPEDFESSEITIPPGHQPSGEGDPVPRITFPRISVGDGNPRQASAESPTSEKERVDDPAAEEQASAGSSSDMRVVCRGCQRSFFLSRIESHEKICKALEPADEDEKLERDLEEQLAKTEAGESDEDKH